MLEKYKMPQKVEVENAILISLFNHEGIIKEFSTGDKIVEEIANKFNLNEEQRYVFLERIYRKENRIVKSPLWTRLLYRAADSLTKDKLITNPKTTFKLTNKKEWMLTEEGYNKVLKLLKIPISEKENFVTKTYEVQKIIKSIQDKPRPSSYQPIEDNSNRIVATREYKVRKRGFRLAVLEAYDYKCAFCGLKIFSLKNKNINWEVQAAHIVPHREKGKDDLLNGLSLCRLHHWAFDEGWLSIYDNYMIDVSKRIEKLPVQYGRLNEFDFIRYFLNDKKRIILPLNKNYYPHYNSIMWHRKNIFLS